MLVTIERCGPKQKILNSIFKFHAFLASFGNRFFAEGDKIKGKMSEDPLLDSF